MFRALALQAYPRYTVCTMTSFPIPPDEVSRLAELHALGILDSEREADFDLLTAVAAEICHAPFAFISFVDAQRVWIKAGYGSDLNLVERSNSYCAVAIVEDGVVEIPDLRADRRTAQLPFTLGSNVNMYAGAILTTPTGHHLGTLCVVDTVVRTLTVHQKDLLRGLGNQVMQLVIMRKHKFELEAVNANLERALSELTVSQNRLAQSQKLAALGVLVAGVSHELNTPIGTGLTVATSLENKLSRFETQRQVGLTRSELNLFVNDARTATNLLIRSLSRAGDIVERLKPIAVRQTELRRRFQLAQVVDAVVADWPIPIDPSKWDVVREVPPGIELESFPESLVQVLGLLLDNCFVHGLRVKAHGKVVIRAHQTVDGHCILEVDDSGDGVNPAHLARLFDPFFTTRMGQGGSGMGLYTVHNIVTAVLAGTVEASSDVGLGMRVVLTLPLCLPSPTTP